MEQRRSKSQRGFSLIEALIAVSIVSVIMGMALINYLAILPNSKANSAMDQLLYQLRSARERAIAHRCEVQVQFQGVNQLVLTEIWFIGVPPPPSVLTFEGGAQYTVFAAVPDVPAPYNYGKAAPIFFGGLNGGPPVMKFTTNGSFISGANALVNGTVFLGIPGNGSTARAITVLGATGRVRSYHWDGTAWQE